MATRAEQIAALEKDWAENSLEIGKTWLQRRRRCTSAW